MMSCKNIVQQRLADGLHVANGLFVAFSFQLEIKGFTESDFRVVHVCSDFVQGFADQYRAQVAELARRVQTVTGQTVKVAFADQGYTSLQVCKCSTVAVRSTIAPVVYNFSIF